MAVCDRAVTFVGGGIFSWCYFNLNQRCFFLDQLWWLLNFRTLYIDPECAVLVECKHLPLGKYRQYAIWCGYAHVPETHVEFRLYFVCITFHPLIFRRCKKLNEKMDKVKLTSNTFLWRRINSIHNKVMFNKINQRFWYAPQWFIFV